MFQSLKPQAADELLGLITLFATDERADKLDLGVGTFRDEHGCTPVMQVVKDAERRLVQSQATKAYLGPAGDEAFTQLVQEVALGRPDSMGGRLVGVQTPGGGGALRLACELIAAARPGARVWLGTPTWPNHRPILAACGLTVALFRHADDVTQSLCFDQMLSSLSSAEPGDVVLLHGCCHNPTGIDLDEQQWRRLARLIEARRLIPLIDLAYQGLGSGLDDDAYGTRLVVDSVEEAFVAYSCDKNFGLYRERTGALFVLARDAAAASVVRGNLLAMARVNWSMPPDHGAAVVRSVLASNEARSAWISELAGMCRRVVQMRDAVACAEPRLGFLREQHGLFCQINVAPADVIRLREQHGIYMASSGRINLAGLTSSTVEGFARALAGAAVLPVSGRTMRRA